MKSKPHIRIPSVEGSLGMPDELVERYRKGLKPRLLDCFCGAGGVTKGFQRAGFYVVGVDIAPQPNYCGDEFHQLDVTKLRFVDQGPPIDHRYMTVNHTRFAALHASVPCQAWARTQKLQGKEYPELIALVRDKFEATGLPYVLENVPGAPLKDPIELCGTMFGLPLYRHRLFEISGFECPEPLHGQHWLKQVKMGRKPGPNELIQPVGNFSGIEQAREAMEMPWASRSEIAEAVPPAYTRFIGEFLRAHIEQEAKAA